MNAIRTRAPQPGPGTRMKCRQEHQDPNRQNRPIAQGVSPERRRFQASVCQAKQKRALDAQLQNGQQPESRYRRAVGAVLCALGMEKALKSQA
ncbi:MAG: hypothetical protein IPH16_09290 [Haliscomenobacter sp.]|nr:hypothetical protein [Haliscomenobacter sp.]